MRRYKYKKPFPVWSENLSYVIGVIATDGNLSSSGRHINVTSKDREMIYTIKKILRLKNKVSKKARGGAKRKQYFFLQFGDVCFYDFLTSVGLTPAKSKTIKKLAIPRKYFPDFLRGCIDGDGSIGSFKHPESMLLQVRIRLVSASPEFLSWILQTLQKQFGIAGGWIYQAKGVSTLSFGKNDAIKILRLIYYRESLPLLSRKYASAQKFLSGEW